MSAPKQPQSVDVSLSLDELILFLGDRDLACRALRLLRIPAYDAARPPRVPLDRLERWQRSRGAA